MEYWSDGSSIHLLCAKLKKLKNVVVLWQLNKNMQNHSELLCIEQKMAEIFEKCPSQVFTLEELNLLRSLKQKKDKLLEAEESTWRLRSRAIWIEKGDKNTKKNHKYTTQRRCQNTIWDIADDDGCIKSSEKDIKEVAFKHFQSQYSAIVAEDTCNQISVLKDVPRFFNDDESDEIGKPVTLEEVKETINKMPKEKIPGPDGWTQELFQDFFDIMGEDLHRAVEESIYSGHIPGALNATFFSLIPKVSKP
jgi:hypothetical protein